MPKQYWSMQQLQVQLRSKSLPGAGDYRIINHRGLVYIIRQPQFNYKHMAFIAGICAGTNPDYRFENSDLFRHFVSPPHVKPACMML